MGQIWDANPIHDIGNIACDVGQLFTGPPGDPGRIRDAAQRIERLAWEYQQHAAAINEAVDALTQTWGGDSARAFRARWYAGGGQPGPAHVLTDMHDKLATFAGGLRDYASRLENKQHDHWIELAALAAMTVVNVAQLGADPATDAAEVGMGTAMQIGSSFALPAVTTFAGREAFALFASDVIGQLGAHAWDALDPRFEKAVVPFIDGNELASLLPLPACSVVGPEIVEGAPAVPGDVGPAADGRYEAHQSEESAQTSTEAQIRGDARHIFREAPGHFYEDTPANRQLISQTANNPDNYAGTDTSGVQTFRQTLPNGQQVWAEVYKGEITNGGLNDVPR